MIKIFVQDTSDEGANLIGVFNPPDVKDVLSLMKEYGVHDAEGATGKVERIVYDVGFCPSIYVNIEYD